MLIVLFVMGLCGLQVLGVEAVKAILEDVKLIEINSQYFDPEKCELRIDEDEETEETSVTAVLTVIKTLPVGTRGHVTSMMFSMGRYTIPTGIDITADLCEVHQDPVLGGEICAKMGWINDECPPTPGIYSLERYQPPTDIFDEVLENKYLIHIEFGTDDVTLLSYDVYTFIQNE